MLKSKIRETRTQKRDWIDLSGLQIERIPNDLQTIKNVVRIDLSNNNISTLPSWFKVFKNLEVLDLRFNNFEILPKVLTELKKLKTVRLSYNSIQNLPEKDIGLSRVESLFITDNQISKLPLWISKIDNLAISNNPVVDPPFEIYNRGLYAIRNYFEEREKGQQKIYEAKLLIIGEPGAGKTSFMKRFIDSGYMFDKNEVSTQGIEIKPHFFSTPKKLPFRINIWDFGGQEIYHATHQFFLTKRSLYILIADNRSEDTDFNYWLQTVELLSDSSPLIIFQNEKQDRKKDINISGIRDRFSNLNKSFSFNLFKNTIELDQLRNFIEFEIQRLPHIGSELPLSWIKIRDELEKKSDEYPYISDDEYFKICKRIGDLDKGKALILSDYYHDLGTLLHFKENPILKRWIILKPEWGTDAVYKILDNEIIIKKGGYFDTTDLYNIWSNNYYINMHDELLSLMMQFELCYEIANEATYIAPQLLAREKPKYEFDDKDTIKLIYDYDFLPKGIMTRFIVRTHYYISNQKLVWREGVVLKRNNTEAEIIQTYGREEIQIRVTGNERREFLAIIKDNIDRINDEYKNIKVKTLIPCACRPCNKSPKKYFHKYELLRRYLDKGLDTIRCEFSLEEQKVKTLLYQIERNPSSIDSSKKVFLSYSDQDREKALLFKKSIKMQILKHNLKIWDKDLILAGEDYRIQKLENLMSAEVIISLFSMDYLNDNECFKYELAKALDFQESKGVLFIPVILRDGDYDGIPFGGSRPIYYDDKAIYSNKNIDRVLKSVSTEIGYLIGNHIRNGK